MMIRMICMGKDGSNACYVMTNEFLSGDLLSVFIKKIRFISKEEEDEMNKVASILFSTAIQRVEILEDSDVINVDPETKIRVFALPRLGKCRVISTVYGTLAEAVTGYGTLQPLLQQQDKQSFLPNSENEMREYWRHVHGMGE